MSGAKGDRYYEGVPAATHAEFVRCKPLLYFDIQTPVNARVVFCLSDFLSNAFLLESPNVARALPKHDSYFYLHVL